MCQQICVDPPCDCDVYACRCIPDEQAVAFGDAVAVPVRGTWLVEDGVVTQVHEVRKEADYMLNRCAPGDICGAEDGCNDV